MLGSKHAFEQMQPLVLVPVDLGAEGAGELLLVSDDQVDLSHELLEGLDVLLSMRPALQGSPVEQQSGDVLPAPSVLLKMLNEGQVLLLLPEVALVLDRVRVRGVCLGFLA